jgi:hypothetical protein
VLGALGGGSAEPQWRSADTAFTAERVLPDGASSASTWLRCGPAEVQVLLQTREGVKQPLTLRPFSISLPATGAGATPVALAEAGVEMPGLRVRRYVRPNPLRLKADARARLLKAWDSLPSPLTRATRLAFVQNAADVDCYLDGLYAGKALRQGTLQTLRFTIAPGSALGETEFGVTPPAGFLPLDLTALDQPGKWAGAHVVIGDRLAPVPLSPLTATNLDLGVTARHQDLYTEYTHRGAFDGLTDSYLLTVPRAQYTRAWVWCAVENDPDKDPALTARLTRFVSGGPYTGRARDCLADTTVTLPREGGALPPEVTRVGTVTAGGKELPLYRVEIGA